MTQSILNRIIRQINGKATEILNIYGHKREEICLCNLDAKTNKIWKFYIGVSLSGTLHAICSSLTLIWKVNTIYNKEKKIANIKSKTFSEEILMIKVM